MLVIDLEDLYFDWLLGRLEPGGVTEGVAYLCDLLSDCEFHRRVGNDVNRAESGMNLRSEFIIQYEENRLNPHVTNDLMAKECSWLEMLIALAQRLDYIYDGGVYGRFIELIINMGLDDLAIYDPDRTHARQIRDRHIVGSVTTAIDTNRFQANGFGGLFPLQTDNSVDQRTVEIWDQVGAYFNERL